MARIKTFTHTLSAGLLTVISLCGVAPVVASTSSAEPLATPVATPASPQPASTPLGVVSSAGPVYEALVARFRGGNIFTGTFETSTTDSFTGEESVFSGTLWLGLDRYRVETRDQILVVSDSTSRVLDRIRNRFILSDYRPEEDDVAPSRTLSRIDTSMSVTETRQRNGSTLIELVSSDPYAPLLRISITVSRDGIPVSIEAVDQVENLIVTRFSRGKWTAGVERLFTLDPPEGAEVLDLREGL